MPWAAAEHILWSTVKAGREEFGMAQAPQGGAGSTALARSHLVSISHLAVALGATAVGSDVQTPDSLATA